MIPLYEILELAELNYDDKSDHLLLKKGVWIDQGTCTKELFRVMEIYCLLICT